MEGERERGREVRLVRVPDPVLACGRVDARVSEREKQKKIHCRHACCVGDINASKVSAGSACVSPGSEREPVALKKRVVIEEMNCQQILPLHVKVEDQIHLVQAAATGYSTGVPRSQENASPQEPTLGIWLGPYRGPRRGGRVMDQVPL